MNLTVEQAIKFAGCDATVESPEKDRLFRGPIKRAWLEDGKLSMQMEWLAKSNGGLSNPGDWTKIDKSKNRIIGFRVSSVSESDGMTILPLLIDGDRVVIFPRDGEKLNPTFVEGF